MPSIYKITNLINNKIYIGLTSKNTEERTKEHFNNKNSKQNKNCLLHRAIKKYGKDNFKIETIVEGKYNKILLGELEKHYIRLYNSYAGTSKYGYNLTTGGEGTCNKVITEETRKRMSIAQKNKEYKHPKEIMDKFKNSRKGIKVSSETKLKQSISLKKVVKTKEWKEKISKTLMGHTYNKGISKSKEHKEKLKQANLELIKNGYRLPFCKYVYQYDLNNILIKRFDTVTEASKQLKISKNKILDYSKGVKIHSNYNFIITKEVLNA